MTCVGCTIPLHAQASRISQQLNALYPDPPIPLDHKTPFQLLVAVVLSAQVCHARLGALS